MLNILLNLFIISSIFFTGDPAKKTQQTENKPKVATLAASVVKDAAMDFNVLYKDLDMANMGLNQDVFNKAMKGWNALKEQNNLPKSGILSIVDFSQSSTKKRLYIIDMVNKKILFNTFVAHGRGSGNEFADNFSNVPESYQSSLGFYVTGGTYTGKHGMSLRLKGVEEGINDLAEARAIVIHGADYVSENFIKSTGRLGRSHGCPAVPSELSKPIIETVKDGSCLFLYHPDKNYVEKSKITK